MKRRLLTIFTTITILGNTCTGTVLAGSEEDLFSGEIYSESVTREFSEEDNYDEYISADTAAEDFFEYGTETTGGSSNTTDLILDEISETGNDVSEGSGDVANEVPRTALQETYASEEAPQESSGSTVQADPDEAPQEEYAHVAEDPADIFPAENDFLAETDTELIKAGDSSEEYDLFEEPADTEEPDFNLEEDIIEEHRFPVERAFSANNHNDAVIASTETIHASQIKTICSFYPGSNVEAQDYPAFGVLASSYLVPLSDGRLMRVQGGAVSGNLLIEYYDSSFNIEEQSTKTVPLSLPILGGFYASSDAYYVVTGQNNEEHNDSKVVYQIEKYSREWNKLGTISIKAKDTHPGTCMTAEPFAFAGTHITMSGKYLFIRTGQVMYNGHQVCFTIEIDTENMNKIYSQIIGWVSHSFNSFPMIDGNSFVSADQGDAYERGVVLQKYDWDASSGDINLENNGSPSTLVTWMEFPGEDTYTGVSLGNFVQSDSSYLIAGNRDITFGNEHNRDIFVLSYDKRSGTSILHSFTNMAGKDATASTPHFIKAGDNSFILLWSSNGHVYYTKVDGEGNGVDNIYYFTGNLSDCVPVIQGGRLIWYTWNNGTIVFYEINLSDLKRQDATIIENGHKYKYSKVKNGEITGTCTVCGTTETFSVPTDIWMWSEEDGNDAFMGYSGNEYEVNTGALYKLSTGCKLVSEDNKLTKMTLQCSDDSVLSTKVEDQPFGVSFTANAVKKGRADITISSVYNPAVTWTGTFYVNKLRNSNIKLSTTSFAYNGKARKPEVTVSFAGKKLKKGQDYTVQYDNNVAVGTAKVIVTGIGSYCGTGNASFKITKGTQKISASNKKVYVNSSKRVKLGALLKAGNGKLTYTSGNKAILQVYSNGTFIAKKPGIVKITIKAAGTSKYKAASKKVTIRVRPRKPGKLSRSNKASNQLVLKWKKISEASGYEISYATKSNYANSKTIKIKGASVTNKTISVQKGKTYYVRIRSYTTSNGKKICSAWVKFPAIKIIK